MPEGDDKILHSGNNMRFSTRGVHVDKTGQISTDVNRAVPQISNVAKASSNFFINWFSIQPTRIDKYRSLMILVDHSELMNDRFSPTRY